MNQNKIKDDDELMWEYYSEQTAKEYLRDHPAITNPELSEAAAHEYATNQPLGSYIDQKAAFLAGVEYMKKQLTT